ncbi:alanine--tRNA ligase [Armatimonas sp.]|uniref:alanine--tRNA ligase n=1 Tax=Armatimonas sp. TaxID=1872638 RepID=UPI00374D96A1
MLARELRQKYLSFFESKGALRLPSDPLPTDDPTLLFTVAGMVPFKAYFEDRATPPRKSVVTSQKCLRTKDIEDIGDISHCTFFEMLGNFSFGDYFKKEAIAWSTEFLFDVLKLERSRIRVTIYEEDQEAYDFWRANGMPHERIARLGQKTNYWPSNAIVEQSQGPCGPCSEIFFDLQPQLPFDQDWDGEGSRWLEIWNNVFTQYTGQGTGDDYKLIELPKKNIDTGMGLERTAAAINNLAGPFETDLLRPVIAVMEQLSGKSYTSTPDSPTDIAFRRIADHVRAATFILCDGVTPGSSDKGYILRRLMRRAIVAGIRHLGFENETFMDRAVPGVVQNMKDYYPELVDRQEAILEAVKLEETSFRNTLKNGLARLEDALVKGTLDGAEAHFLYHTYGLPFEVTAEVALERGITVDRESYETAQKEHSEKSKNDDVVTWVVTDESTKELLRSLPHTKFVGYDQVRTETQVVGILQNGKPLQELAEGEEAELILAESPFYAESGGQVGDTGTIDFDQERGAGVVYSSLFEVTGTHKRDGIWFHHGKVTQGTMPLHADVTAKVSAERFDIRRNHTATHLLHKALRSQLGTHVAQKGSLVAPDRLRFDFSHNTALTDDELVSIEVEVNRAIRRRLRVEIIETSQEEARKHGAMMLFGEKYGDVVRMVSIGSDYSIELCGGIHVASAEDIGLFRIVSEGSAAAGVRRIEALTGRGAYEYLTGRDNTLKAAGSLLSAKPEAVPEAIERLQAHVKELQHELKSLKSAATGSLADTLLAEAIEKDGYKVIVAAVETDDVSKLADELVGRIGAGVVVLGAVSGEKLVFVAKATKDAVAKGVHCGNLVKAAAQASGGGGGGRPDFAQAGGRDASKLDDALAAARAALG